MDTLALRLFVLAAKKQNISAAGRVLGLAPSVASAKLAKLESQLQADLLHRTTRSVVLSLEGQEFLPFATDIVAKEDAALSALGRGKPEATGKIRFTAPASFSQMYIAPIIPRFLKENPRLELDLRFSDHPFDLVEGSFDLALRNASLDDSSLIARKLAIDTRLLCAAPSYLATAGIPLTANDLSQHDLIAFGDRGARPLIRSDGEKALFDPSAARSRVRVDDGQSQKQLTLAGAGISANALWAVHEELAAGLLVKVLPNYEIADDAAIWLIYPKSNVLSAKVRVLIDFLRREIGTNPPWQRHQRRTAFQP